ncbi:MAG: hypothetical protein KDC58_12930, partial [Cyclobacteriaceae bacterium]|nr:hypothetical protein [Cyclobacteriaceae bacterium]
FIVAFGVKYVKANAVFVATLISEGIIVWLYFLSRAGKLGITYLWFNPIGALLVVAIAVLLQAVWPNKKVAA